MVWVSRDARHEWASTGGWRGGAARFYPPTQDQSYCGVTLGNFLEDNGEIKQLNIRFLINHGRTYGSLNPGRNKVLIINRIDPVTRVEGTRAMIIEWKPDSGDWLTYGACHNIVCEYESGDYWPDGTESFRIGSGIGERSEEWISVELEANIDTGRINIYVHTQDGELSGLYVSQSMNVDPNELNDPDTVWQYINILGGYFNYGSPADPNNYFMFDELSIDSSYIGPPEGFLSDPPPGAPTSSGVTPAF